MTTRALSTNGGPERAAWQRPAVKKIEAGSAETGPKFTVEGGSAS